MPFFSCSRNEAFVCLSHESAFVNSDLTNERKSTIYYDCKLIGYYLFLLNCKLFAIVLVSKYKLKWTVIYWTKATGFLNK